ncbi:MAG TPA: hypothetical protein DCY13_16610 [Verrucomicrobiales bacterium]|nr:hypothetical protein [Verrucomicrobiales bacterium]
MDTPSVNRIAETVSAWPGIQTDRLPSNGTDFLLGRREIGHVHGNDSVDIPFPRRVRDELVAAGRAQPHHWLVQSGWVTIPLCTATDVERAIELLKLSYELAVN